MTAAPDHPNRGSRSTRPLRAGVIGLGWAGQQHMTGYRLDDSTELVALSGMEADELGRLGEQHEVEHRYTDWQAMIAEAELDVLSVCTPTALHAPMAIGALNAGIHVLSEKPMADHAGNASAMVEAAKANDRVLDVSFNHRRRGDVVAAKRIVDQGVLGKIYYAKAGWMRRAGIPGLGSWFTKKALAGGGPMMDLGVHMLDIALHLMGEPTVTTVSGSSYAEFGPRGLGGASSKNGGNKWSGGGEATFEVEDLATAFVRLSDSSTLLLETSWASFIPADQIYCTLYGTEGGAHLCWSQSGGLDQSLQVWTDVRGVPAELKPDIGAGAGHAACVADFLTKVLSDDWSEHRGQQALTRALIIDACYASAEAGAEVAL